MIQVQPLLLLFQPPLALNRLLHIAHSGLHWVAAIQYLAVNFGYDDLHRRIVEARIVALLLLLLLLLLRSRWGLGVRYCAGVQN